MNEWISVKDRLPETDKFVLAKTADDVTMDGRMNQWNQWWSKYDVPIGITHWQPLPQPPEQESDDEQ